MARASGGPASAIGALLGKDLREHGWPLAGLLLASVALVLVAIAQNRAAAYGLSPFEVVRFALITFLPLVTLIVGNRLVVREYLSGTRRFVEALPVGTIAPLALKFLVGWLYLATIGALLIGLCTLGATLADDPVPRYLALLYAKTLTVLFLYWSLVFCFSLCGHLRIVLYLVTVGIVLAIAWWPAIDATRFAPFALLDRELFVFERDLIPWRDMGWTLLLGVAFAVAGFVIARLGNGSVSERLARPMSRRDYVVLGVLGMAGLALASTIAENRSRDPVSFSGETVLRSARPEIELYFGVERHRADAERFLDAVLSAVTPLEAELGLESLPAIRLALRPERERHDIDYGTLDGVYVAGNWLDQDAYDDAVLVAVVLHGVLTARTDGRAAYEPYHWVLDGFTRWWSETGGDPEALPAAHRDELLARAWLTGTAPAPDPVPGDRLSGDERSGAVPAADLIRDWQGLAEGFGYPGAEALAFSAMLRLEQRLGVDAVLALAREFLSRTLSSTVAGSLQDRRQTPQARFEAATGLSWQDFTTDWRGWLAERPVEEAGVRALVERIVPLRALAVAGTDGDGVPIITAGFERRPFAPIAGVARAVDDASIATSSGSAARGIGATTECYLKHAVLTPFASEWDVDDEDERTATCAADASLFALRAEYASGDRAYLALGFRDPAFHQDVRLGAFRVDVP